MHGFSTLSAFSLLIPLALIMAYAWWALARRTPSILFSQVSLAKLSQAGYRRHLLWMAPVAKVAAIVLMIIALARPQVSSERVKKNVEGVDIVLLVDLSPTMLIEDMQPYNRLEAAKKAQIEFVKHRPTDRIGIVAFSGEAYTAVPPTLDHQVVIDRLNELKFSPYFKQGTAQGVAIATGVARLKDSTAKSRIMVFITDGENNTGTIAPETALEMAKGFGIKIYTVGVGSDGEKMLAVPVQDPFGRTTYQRQKMTSTFHEDAMRSIASETGGKYWRSQNMRELKAVYDEIDRLEKTKIDSNVYLKYSELFQKYVQWALLLFSLSWFLNHVLLRRVPA